MLQWIDLQYLGPVCVRMAVRCRGRKTDASSSDFSIFMAGEPKKEDLIFRKRRIRQAN